MDSKTFRKKAEERGLSLTTWFNLLLVYKGARPGCLFCGDNRRIIISNIFPFFKLYQFNVENDKDCRLYYIDEKVIQKGLDYSDIELLQIGYWLGYTCPGEMAGEINPHKFSYGRNFYVNNKQIYGEICWNEKKFDDNKLKKFQKIADEFGWKVEERRKGNITKSYTGKTIKLVDDPEINGLPLRSSVLKKWKKFDSYDQALRSLKLKNVLPPSIARTYKEGVEYYYHLNKHNEKSEKENGVFAIWI